MTRKTRAAAWLLTFVLTLGLFVPPPAAAAELYFTSVNDHLTPLTSDTMPVWSGGILYVPYTVFDSASNGNNDLGLNITYNQSTNILFLYDLSKKLMLSFDLTNRICRNEMTGEIYPSQCITRNSLPYLPLARVCEFFGLNYSYIPISYVSQGYLIRVKDEQVVLSDALFLDAATNLVNQRLREYNQSISPSPQISPDTPSVPSSGQSSHTAVPTFLAVRSADGKGLPRILNTLTSRDTCALFLLTPQVLAEQGHLVRQLLGTGHSVGIWAEGANAEETRALLEEGSRLLEGLAHIRTTVALVPKEQRETMEAEGWVCWSETLALSPGTSEGAAEFASSTLRRLSGRSRTTYLTLEGGSAAARVLPTLLDRLDAEYFEINIPLETRL